MKLVEPAVWLSSLFAGLTVAPTFSHEDETFRPRRSRELTTNFPGNCRSASSANSWGRNRCADG